MPYTASVWVATGQKVEKPLHCVCNAINDNSIFGGFSIPQKFIPMPGLITHQRIFIESVKSLKKQKYPNYATHILDIQFSNHLFTSSSLAGLLVPNLFDYIPGKRDLFFGNLIKHLLHSDDGLFIIHNMFNTILHHVSYEPNEWLYYQKGFFYGYISHWVVDALFHPFVFYWSGFPTFKDHRTALYRNQHLLFEYTVDQYMAYYFNSDPFDYNLAAMIPIKGSLQYSAIKDLIAGAIAHVNPSLKINHPLFPYMPYDIFDIALKCVPLVYLIKKTRNPQLIRILRFFEKKVYSDFLVRYPDGRRINRHILNLHRERWFIPTGEPGLHYESVDDLFKIARDKTVQIWKQLEEMFTQRTEITAQQLRSVLEYANAYTGKEGFSLDKMTLQNPIRLRN
ncbi:MAG: hypothetical protein N3F66_06755 [Spirochaetes bacterium]|nr:hypothetical protein [Spirochaetota bacterium]